MPKGYPWNFQLEVGLAALSSCACLCVSIWSSQYILLCPLRQKPHLHLAIFGVAWAASTALLLPTLGFVQHGWPVLAADRYYYLPSMVWVLPSAALLEPIVAAALCCTKESKQSLSLDVTKKYQIVKSARLTLSMIFFLCIILAVQSSHALLKWTNSSNLWAHAAFVYPRDCTSVYNLGVAIERLAVNNPVELVKSQLFVNNHNLSKWAPVQNNADIVGATKGGPSKEYTKRNDAHTLRAVHTLAVEGVLKAESLFALATELDPTYGAAFNNRGQLAERRGGIDGIRIAEESYRTAITLNPNTHYKAYNNLASMLHRQAATLRGKSKNKEQEKLMIAAEDNYRKAIQIFPRYHVALFNLATLLHTTGRRWTSQIDSLTEQTVVDEALSLYRESIRANPLMAESYFNYASLLLRDVNSIKRHSNEVLDSLEMASKLRPNHRATADLLEYVRRLVQK